MPGYTKGALKKLLRPEDSTYPAPNTKWGPDSQLTAPSDASKRLDATAVNRLQQFFGTLLYYARAVDPTMVKALGSLAAQKSEATDATANG